MVKNPKYVCALAELPFWTILLWKLYRLVRVHNFFVCVYSEHSWIYKTWVVSWHPSSYLSTYPYRQTWLHKTLDVKVHGVAPLGWAAASGQCLRHFRREVKRNCGLKTRGICGPACGFVTTVFDVSLKTFLKYFDEYPPEIKFETVLYLCEVQPPL